ncbi:TPA: acyl carrier protein [Vibrio parahaemolyticus]|nr:acyl carrier protein [Vibrio parahaemolyticus]
MEYLKLVFCSVLAITYSNFVWASSCDAVDDKVLDAMVKTLNVHMDEIAIGVELKDEDVVDPIVYFDEEEFELKIKDKVTVREFQETVHKACVKSLG